MLKDQDLTTRKKKLIDIQFSMNRFSSRLHKYGSISFDLRKSPLFSLANDVQRFGITLYLNVHARVKCSICQDTGFVSQFVKKLIDWREDHPGFPLRWLVHPDHLHVRPDVDVQLVRGDLLDHLRLGLHYVRQRRVTGLVQSQISAAKHKPWCMQFRRSRKNGSQTVAFEC